MIFLDTNYIVSYFIKTEEYHHQAVKLANNIKNREK
jgi:predicted nucleic acid-binding protein